MLLFSCSAMSNFLWLHGLQHNRLPCVSPSPGDCSNSCLLSRQCDPTILSSIVPFFSCLLTFLASEPFPMSWPFTLGGQNLGTSALALVLPMNIQDWLHSRLTGFISLPSKGRSRVFSNREVWKHWFFSAQPSLWSSCHIDIWLLEKTTDIWLLQLHLYVPLLEK